MVETRHHATNDRWTPEIMAEFGLVAVDCIAESSREWVSGIWSTVAMDQRP